MASNPLNRIQSLIDSGRIDYNMLNSQSRAMFKAPETEEEKRKKALAAQAQTKAVEQNQNVANMFTTASSRKITNGVDPALAKVTTFDRVKAGALPGIKKAADFAVTRIPSALAGANIEAERAADRGVGEWSREGFNAGLQGFKKGITGQEKYKFTDYLTEKGWEGDGTGKNLVGGALEMASNPFMAMLPGMKIAGKLGVTNPIAKTALGSAISGGTYGTAEGIAQGEDLKGIGKSAALNALLWSGTELGMKGAAKALGEGAQQTSKYLNAPKAGEVLKPTNVLKDRPTNLMAQLQEKSPFYDDSLFGMGDEAVANVEQSEAPQTTQTLNEWLQNKQAKGEAPIMPQGNSDNSLLTKMQKQWNTPVNAVQGPPKPPMARPTILDRGVDTAKIPDRYPLPDVSNLEGKVWAALSPEQQAARLQAEALAKVQAENAPRLPNVRASKDMTAQQRENRVLSPQDMLTANKVRDIGTAAGNLPKADPYNVLIADEVARMKAELGGVSKYMPNGQDGLMQRASLNPKWYRDFWKAQGRAPNASELRTRAIDNLRNGVDDIPANTEFLKMEKQMQTGKQMPEDWQNIEQVIKEIDNNDAYSWQEKAQAIRELRGEQDRLLAGQNNPQPLDKASTGDSISSRLIQSGDEAMQRVRDRNAAYSNPNAEHFIPRNPVDDLKDLAIIGAAKIAKTGLNFDTWQKAMIKELGKEGKIYEPALKHLWEHSQALASGGSTVIKYGGKNIAVSLEKNMGGIVSQAANEKTTTGQNGGKAGKLPGIKQKADDWNHIVSKTDKNKASAKNIVDNVYNKVFDDLNRLKQVDEGAYTLALNAREAGGIAK